MNMEIINLINEYNQANKKVDYGFYVKMFEIFKNTYGLDGYLNELVFIPAEDHMNQKYEKYTKGFAGLFGQAAYENSTGNLIVYERNINWGKGQEIRELKLDGNSEVIIFNLLVLQTLLHEMEHANQKKMKDVGTDIESELIRVSDTDKVETTESYEYSLIERLAEMKSIGQILEMYQYLGIDNQVIYDFFDKRFKEEAVRGYHYEDENGYKTESGTLVFPTFKYTSLKEGDMDKLRELSTQVQGDDRIKYGLEISEEEYQMLLNLSGGFQI